MPAKSARAIVSRASSRGRPAWHAGQLERRERDDALITSEREELTRLRRENARLRQEKEILRKAAAFFECGGISIDVEREVLDILCQVMDHR